MNPPEEAPWLFRWRLCAGPQALPLSGTGYTSATVLKVFLRVSLGKVASEVASVSGATPVPSVLFQGKSSSSIGTFQTHHPASAWRLGRQKGWWVGGLALQLLHLCDRHPHALLRRVGHRTRHRVCRLRVVVAMLCQLSFLGGRCSFSSAALGARASVNVQHISREASWGSLVLIPLPMPMPIVCTASQVTEWPSC